MCGIVGIIGIKGAADAVRRGLERLEYRGYDSAGIGWLDGDKVATVRAVGGVAQLPATKASDETMAIGHTRWATHGGVTVENAHPHRDGSKRFAIVHNGTIDGDDHLRQELQGRGAIIRSETDSELLAHRYAELRADLPPADAMASLVDGIEGSWAIVLLDAEAGVLAFARHKTPLCIGIAEDGYIVASDVTAIVEHTKQVVFLEDGQYGTVGPHGLDLRGADGSAVEPDVQAVTWDVKQAERAGYEHFMLKEIHEAPQALNQCLAGRLRHDPGSVDLRLPASVFDHTRVRIVACGTSWHAGLTAQRWFEHWAHIPTDVLRAGEVHTRLLPDDQALYIAISQSGETLDTVEAVRRLRDQGRPVLAIVNAEGSTLGRMADHVLHLRVGPEVGVAASKTYVGQLAVLAMLALSWGQHNGRLRAADLRRHLDGLQRLPRTLDAILSKETALAELAKSLAKASSSFFLGDGPLHGTALEAALKFKEITYCHSEGFPAAELKHGPFALLTGKTPCVIFAKPSTAVRAMRTVQEIRARGAPCMAIMQGDHPDGHGATTARFTVPAGDEDLAPIPFAIIGQLLAYWAAHGLGREIDRPRNLAKSVTVE